MCIVHEPGYGLSVMEERIIQIFLTVEPLEASPEGFLSTGYTPMLNPLLNDLKPLV